jgi:hypothetical protein
MPETFVKSRVHLPSLIEEIKGPGDAGAKVALLREALNTLNAEIDEYIGRGGVEVGLIEDRDFIRDLVEAADRKARRTA